jgi:hypothetical protein
LLLDRAHYRRTGAKIGCLVTLILMSIPIVWGVIDFFFQSDATKTAEIIFSPLYILFFVLELVIALPVGLILMGAGWIIGLMIWQMKARG